MCSRPFTGAKRQGQIMLAAVTVWGAAFAGFALVSELWPTLALLGVAGAADTITVVLRSAVLQANAPEHARGRVSAAEYVVSGTGSYIGDLGSGAFAILTTPVTSAFVGGLATVAGTLTIALALPKFRRYRTTSTLSPSEPIDTATPTAPPDASA